MAQVKSASTSTLGFVILLGFVSLCADMIYKGVRSITGAYLGVLGANGTVVGLIASFEELMGYGFCLVIGNLSDQTRKNWGITTLGYFINTAVMPLLALAGPWEVVAGLMRLLNGKAIRTPSRDVLLSHAASQVARGNWLWLVRGYGANWCCEQVIGCSSNALLTRLADDSLSS